jgi:hypothetical protein
MQASFGYDILDEGQRTKHADLVKYLKEHPDEWFTVQELDASAMPSGARLAAFPREWLEQMILYNRRRYSRFELQCAAGTDDDSDAPTLTLSFSIRYRRHQPRSEAELVAMVRYPAADRDNVDDENEDDDNVDDMDLAVLSSAFENVQTQKTLDHDQNQRTPATSHHLEVIERACAKGSVLAIPIGASHKRTGGGVAMFDQPKELSNAAAGGVDMVEEREFQAWWGSSPVMLQSKHTDGVRMVTDVLQDTLPHGIRDQDVLRLYWRRREHHPLNRRIANSAAAAAGERPQLFTRCYRVTMTVHPPNAITIGEDPNGSKMDGAWMLAELPQQRAVVELRPDVRGMRPLKIALKNGHDVHQEPQVRFVFAVDELIGTAVNRVSETRWTMLLTWPPRLFSTGKRQQEFALFRRELHAPMLLPPEVMLRCFAMDGTAVRTPSIVSEGSEHHDHGAGDATIAPAGIPSSSSLLQERHRLPFHRSWWANMSPTVARLAHGNRPTTAEVTAAEKSAIAPVVLTHQLSGAVQTIPDVVGQDATTNIKRKRFRDLRNTHMVHLGLDLQKPMNSNQHRRFRQLQL